MALSSTVLTLNGEEYTINRATLKLWLQLEDLKDKVKTAAEIRDRQGLESSICSYISAVLGIELEDLPWYEVANAFYAINNINQPSLDFPFLRTVLENIRVSWDYEGRTWYIWLHLLSSKGWTVEYISDMNIDDAIGLAQEIAIEKQLDLEAQWAMSQNSISYDKNGNGKFQPLKRPDWMQPKPREIQIVKIPKSMLPQGMVLTWAKDETSTPQ